MKMKNGIRIPNRNVSDPDPQSKRLGFVSPIETSRIRCSGACFCVPESRTSNLARRGVEGFAQTEKQGGGGGGLLKIQELSFTSNTPAKFFFARNFTVEKPWAVLLRLVQAAEKNSSLPDQQTKSSLLEQQKNSCLLMLLKKKKLMCP